MKPTAALVRSAQASIDRKVKLIDRAAAGYIDEGRGLESLKADFPNSNRFEAFVYERWGWSRAALYRRIRAANIAISVSNLGPAPASEDVALALADLDAKELKPVWKHACETANGRVTRKHLDACIEEITGRAPGGIPGEQTELGREAYEALSPQAKAEYQKRVKEQQEKNAAPKQVGGAASGQHIEQATYHLKIVKKHLEALGDGEAEAELAEVEKLIDRISKLEAD